MKIDFEMIKSLASDATSLAAINCYKKIGLYSSKELDKVATESIQEVLKKYNVNATVHSGEGERDESYMLKVGDRFYGIGPELEIAVDPLECTASCEKGLPFSMSVMSIGPKNSIMKMPDVYMEKLATAIDMPSKIISLDQSLTQNLQNFCDFCKIKPSDVLFVTLSRDRHSSFVNDAKKFGTQIEVIEDGDISCVVKYSNFFQHNKYAIYRGIGGSPEGAILACILTSIGGFMEGKFSPIKSIEIERMAKLGIKNSNKILQMKDLCKKTDVVSSITYITKGISSGVYQFGNKLNSISMVFAKRKAQIEMIKNVYSLD